MAGIDNLAAVMGRDADMDHVERDNLCDEAAAEIERLRAALADVKERCAKVAEEIGEKHLQWSKMNLPVEPSPIIAKDRADVAKRIAASIRALE